MLQEAACEGVFYEVFVRPSAFSIINHIIGGVTKFIQPLLGGLDKILMGFSPLNFLKSTADAILGIADSLSCNAIAPEFTLTDQAGTFTRGERIIGSSSGAEGRIIDISSPMEYVLTSQSDFTK